MFHGAFRKRAVYRLGHSSILRLLFLSSSPSIINNPQNNIFLVFAHISPHPFFFLSSILTQFLSIFFNPVRFVFSSDGKRGHLNHCSEGYLSTNVLFPQCLLQARLLQLQWYLHGNLCYQRIYSYVLIESSFTSFEKVLFDSLKDIIEMQKYYCTQFSDEVTGREIFNNFPKVKMNQK